MNRITTSAAILLFVSAPVISSATELGAAGDAVIQDVGANDDFAEFLKRYTEFKLQRDKVDISTPQARFEGHFSFREQGCLPFIGVSPGYGQTQCACPSGNHYLQCLTSASVTIHADPSDYGGRGYVMIQSINDGNISILTQGGQWVSPPQFKNGKYSALIDSLRPSQTIEFGIPSQNAIANICGIGGASITLYAGYGAVMPMDVELSERVKKKSAEFGKSYDTEGYLWSRARINGYKPKKAGQVGTITCRPPDEVTN